MKHKRDSALNNSLNSLDRMWFYLALAFLFLFVAGLNYTKIEENDTWWHIALGRWMVQNRHIYRTEIFSQTGLGQPFLAHEWLAEILFYLFSSPKGILLSLFKWFVVVGSTTALVYKIAKPYIKGKLTYLICAGLAFLIAFRAPVRPQIFEILGASLLMIILEMWQKRPSWRSLCWLVPIQIFWANAHGSYLLGPMILFLFWGSLWISQKFPVFSGDKDSHYSKEQINSLLFVGLILLLVSLINPFHWHLLEKSLSVFFIDNYMKDVIREWYSVFRVEKGYWFYVWCVWIGWGWWSFYKNRHLISLLEFNVLLLATMFPCIAVRFVTFSAILSFPQLLKRSHALFPEGFKPILTSVVFIPLTAWIFITGYPVSGSAAVPAGAGFNFGVVPSDIIQHIKANHLKGVVLNHYHDGAFFIAYTYPEVLPVIDSRTDFFGGERVIEHGLAYSSLELFNRYVSKYKVNLVVARLIPETENLRNHLFSSPDWRIEKLGLDNILFSKVSPINPRVSQEEIQKSLLDSYSKSKKLENLPDTNVSFCGFVRLFGHCELAPECHKLCDATDSDLTREMHIINLHCLKISQVCFRKESACGGCYDLCRQYNRVISKVNQLGFHYPNGGSCGT